MSIHLKDVEIFHRMSENFDVLVVLEVNQGIIKVIRLYPLGITNLCTKFHGNRSNGCRDISDQKSTDLAPNFVTENCPQIAKRVFHTPEINLH